jgi:hypothetical protein
MFLNVCVSVHEKPTLGVSDAAVAGRSQKCLSSPRRFHSPERS